MAPRQTAVPGRTGRAAHKARETHGSAEIVEARELIEAQFQRGQSPSLAARRTLILLLATAAADGFEDRLHRVSKREIRQGHKGNERLKDVLDEVAATRLTVPSISSRGQAAILRTGLFESMWEETDEGDSSWVEFKLNPHVRRLLGGSSNYAVLNRAALMAFQSRYSVTLYEIGCLYCGRRDPTVRLTVPALRQRLGVPTGVYGDFAQLRREVLAKAKGELDQLAHFQITITEHRVGRKVDAVTLGFWMKDAAAINEAAREVDRPKVGRKARRVGTVQRLTLDPLPAPVQALADDEVAF